MNKTLKLLAVLVFTGAALNACGGCQESVEVKSIEAAVEVVEKTKIVDTEVVVEETAKTVEVSE